MGHVVFIGGWRSRRRGYRPYGGGAYGGGPGGGPYGGGYGYGRGYGGGRSCLRDLLLVEGGCCLAELLGCGPQLLLVGPSVTRRAVTGRRRRSAPARIPAARRRPAGERIVGLLLDAITLYQTQVSPKRRPCCRYSPTCSHYAATALQMHGLRRGGWLAARRLLRCRPGAPGGADPVPSSTRTEQVVGERPRL